VQLALTTRSMTRVPRGLQSVGYLTSRVHHLGTARAVCTTQHARPSPRPPAYLARHDRDGHRHKYTHEWRPDLLSAVGESARIFFYKSLPRAPKRGCHHGLGVVHVHPRVINAMRARGMEKLRSIRV